MASSTEEDTSRELRVASRTPVVELGSAIANAIYEYGDVRMRAIGAGSVNQAVKGIARAQGYVAQQGIVIACRPGFLTIQLPSKTPGEPGEDRTAIVFYVFKVKP